MRTTPYNTREAIAHFGKETPVWAYAIKSGDVMQDNSRKKLFQLPIKGIITNRSSETAKPGNWNTYFVPYKKNNMDLAWSKKVHAESRYYAGTKEEAEACYNYMITQEQNKLQEQIQKLEELKIK